MYTTHYNDFDIIVKEQLKMGAEALVLFKEDGRVYDYQVGQIRDIIYEGRNFEGYIEQVGKYLHSDDCFDTIVSGEFLTDDGEVYVGIISKSEDPYQRTIFITPREIETIYRYLTKVPTCAEECLPEDKPITHEITFPDGVKMAIYVCGTPYKEGGPNNTAWTRAVLFSRDGVQVDDSGVCEDLLGKWELQYQGDTYRVVVCASAKLQYNSAVGVKRQQYIGIQKYLNNEPASSEECLGPDESFVFKTVTWADGKYMLLQVVGKPYTPGESNTASVVAHLMSHDGQVLATAQPKGHSEKEFMGSWDVEYDDTIYHAWVYLDEPVQCGH